MARDVDRIAREMFDGELTHAQREDLRAMATEGLEEQARSLGIPPEEVVSDDLVETLAVTTLRMYVGCMDARLSEHISDEDKDRIRDE